jgi:hypothetical protein
MAQPSTIYKSGKLNYVWNYLGKTLKDFAAALSPYLSGGGTVDVNGNLIVADSSSNTVLVANGASQEIPNFSGMLIVNDHFDGYVEMWIAGSGRTLQLGSTATTSNNTLTQSTNDGYEWTNVDNLTGPFTFTVIKTRNGA